VALADMVKRAKEHARVVSLVINYIVDTLQSSIIDVVLHYINMWCKRFYVVQIIKNIKPHKLVVQKISLWCKKVVTLQPKNEFQLRRDKDYNGEWHIAMTKLS